MRRHDFFEKIEKNMPKFFCEKYFERSFKRINRPAHFLELFSVWNRSFLERHNNHFRGSLDCIKCASGSGQVRSDRNLLCKINTKAKKKKKKGERTHRIEDTKISKNILLFLCFPLSPSLYLIALILSIAKNKSTNEKFIEFTKVISHNE